VDLFAFGLFCSHSEVSVQDLGATGRRRNIEAFTSAKNTAVSSSKTAPSIAQHSKNASAKQTLATRNPTQAAPASAAEASVSPSDIVDGRRAARSHLSCAAHEVYVSIVLFPAAFSPLLM
jgi:hypothetical protein